MFYFCLGVFTSVNGPAFKKLPSYAVATTLYRLSDTLLDSDPWLNTSNTCSFPAPWLDTNTSESMTREPSMEITNPDDYIGNYGNHIMTTLGVTANPDSKMSLLFQLGRLNGLLHSTEETDRFLAEITYPWEFAISSTDDNNATVYINCTFIRKDGKVVSAKVADSVDIVLTKGTDLFDPEFENSVSSAESISLPVYTLLNYFVIWFFVTAFPYG